MKNKITLKIQALRVHLLIAIGFIMMMALAPASRAGLNGLYQVDGNTLHLWHLQEGSGTTCYDSVSNQNPQTVNIDLTNTPGPNASPDFAGIYITTNFTLIAQPGPNATIGNNTFQFTNAVTTAKYSCLYVPWMDFGPTNYNEYPINLSLTNVYNYCNTNTGAWCQECLIQPQVNLTTYSSEASESLSGGDGPGANFLLPQRGWQFRIDYNGGKPQLEFNNILDPGTNHDIFGYLPLTGPDALPIAPPWPWYHVAVAYTGSAPTNGDPANVLTMYWTLLDPTRTNGVADILTNYQNAFTFTNAANAATNILLNWKPNTLTTYLYPSNSLIGDINLTVGGNGRGNITNSVAGGAGFLGSMAEFRISMSYRHTNEFEFNTTPYNTAPVILGAPNTNTTVLAQNATLTVQPLLIATQPVTNQWYQIVNGVTNLLAGQTNTLLVISNLSVNAAGNYQLVSMNAYGSTASALGPVMILPGAEGLFNTGCGTNNNPLDQTAPGSVDLHWVFPPGDNPYNNSPNCIVWQDGGPLEPNGVVPANSASVWIGPRLNVASAGVTPGTYTFQTTFQVDETAVNTNTVISGTFGACGANGGSSMTMSLNGVQTLYTMTGNPQEATYSFNLTNGLQQGSNTLQCTAYQNGGDYCALNVNFLASTGVPLTTKPAITNQPVGVTNVYGSTVSFQAVALGAPQIYYYWRSNGVPITQPTWIGTALPYLSFVGTNFSGSQLTGTNYFANYSIVFSNSVGSVTSAVAQLDIQLPPLTVTSAGVPIWDAANNETNIVVTFSQPVTPATATVVGNYSLGMGNPSIISAVMGGASNEVVLTTSSALNPANAYTLTIENVNSAAYGFTMNPSPALIAVGTYPATVALWVKASQGVTADGSGNVSQWNDLSGNGNNLTDAGYGPPYDPLYITNQWGYPVIRFVGTNGDSFNQLQAADNGPSYGLEITSNLTIFTVINYATLAGGTNGDIVSKTADNNIAAPYDYYDNSGSILLFRGNGSTSPSVSSTSSPSIGVPHIVDVVMQGTNVTHRLDGRPNGTGTLSATITDDGQPVFIGTRQDGHNRLTGDLNELVLIGSALSSSDVASMENYLATEYSSEFVPGISTNPPPISFTVTNSNLYLSWPATNTGYQLQAQTNNVSVGLGTNWANYYLSTTGTNLIVIPINLTNGTVFYRLLYTP